MTITAFSLDREGSERRVLIQTTAARSLARRRARGHVMRVLGTAALGLTLAPLALLLGYVTYRGAPTLSWHFLGHLPTPPGIPGGGISNALVGTAIIDGVALAAAVPVGLMVAIYLLERKSRTAAVLRYGADTLTGLPTILIGLFMYSIVVLPLKHFSALAASGALAIIMLPIMVRASEEALRTVPEELWEAGLALGARQSRVIRSVVVRTALPGLVTGNLLALSRAVGETAPLLFTVSVFSYAMNTSLLQPMNSLPYVIFLYTQSAFRDLQNQAWAAAFVLIALVMALALVARVAANRFTRRARA